MVEYVRYRGNEIKVGVGENLFYVSYPAFKNAFDKGFLWPFGDCLDPAKCLEVDSGYLFRFPFPDEDSFAFGDLAGNTKERSLAVKIRPSKENGLGGLLGGEPRDKEFVLNLVQQKFVHRACDQHAILAAVFKDSQSGIECRVENEDEIQEVTAQMLRNHILFEPDKRIRLLYMQTITRVLMGYSKDPGRVIARHIDKAALRARRLSMDSGGCQ